jgi:hypothetical protein
MSTHNTLTAAITQILLSPLQAWSNVYGLGLATFFMLYSIQSGNSLGNAVMCITFLGISCLEFVKHNVGKQWADNPQTSKLSLVLKVSATPKTIA